MPKKDRCQVGGNKNVSAIALRRDHSKTRITSDKTTLPDREGGIYEAGIMTGRIYGFTGGSTGILLDNEGTTELLTLCN